MRNICRDQTESLILIVTSELDFDGLLGRQIGSSKSRAAICLAFMFLIWFLFFSWHKNKQ
jgi:hypothetical protein